MQPNQELNALIITDENHKKAKESERAAKNSYSTHAMPDPVKEDQKVDIKEGYADLAAKTSATFLAVDNATVQSSLVEDSKKQDGFDHNAGHMQSNKAGTRLPEFDMKSMPTFMDKPLTYKREALDKELMDEDQKQESTCQKILYDQVDASDTLDKAQQDLDQYFVWPPKDIHDFVAGGDQSDDEEKKLMWLGM
jgi:hypothetical protein